MGTNENALIIISIFIALIMAQCDKDDVDDLNLSFFGLEDPGMIPQRFGPEDILASSNWNWHSAPIFSNDGQELYFSKYYNNNNHVELSHMKVNNNSWTEPLIPDFGNPEYGENCPVFSYTEDTLYFTSSRSEEKIFMTNRINGIWIEPMPLDIPFPANSFIGHQFSVVKNRSIYFEIWEDGQCDLYYSKFENDSYQNPIKLGDEINTTFNEFAPCVDLNETYIFFCSNRPEGYGFNDIYISVKDSDGKWNSPRNLGPSINTDFEDLYPFITNNGKLFFFVTQKEGDLGYNPYWVSAKIIEELK